MSIDKTALPVHNSNRSAYIREHILDAARVCYKKNPIEKVRLVQIAAEAKLDQITVYHYFQNKQDVLTACILRELRGFLIEIKNDLENVESFIEFIIRTIALIAEKGRKEPLFEFSTMLNSGSLMTNSIDRFKEEMLVLMGTHFRNRFDATCLVTGVRRDIEFEELMNWILHVVLFYPALLSPKSNATVFRSTLKHFLSHK